MNSPLDPSSPASQSGAPRPVPKPGPRPGAGIARKPQAAAQSKAAPVIPHAVESDPAAFGRVDADGTAWVKSSDGSERRVGEFKAGTPQEGLAHFGARFDDLATEVAMLEARLLNHPEEAPRIRKDANELSAGLDTAAVIGDIEALRTRLNTIDSDSHNAEQKATEDKARRREQAVARKEKLAAEAEDIGKNSTDWKAAGDRLRAILDEWKTIRGIDRSTDDQLWKRYSAGRDAFSRRRGAHFSELDKNRGVAKRKKEELVEKAEALQDSTDWGATASEFKNLMSQWKAAGRATRDADDRLWERFKKAQDKFFDARKEDSAQKDADFEKNADAKQQLLDEYDSKIDPSQGIDQARTQLRELQEKWEEIGFVPRARIREFEQKIGALEQRVSDAADAEWRRTDPETQARVAQFQAKVDQLTAEAEAAEAKGNTKKAAQLREQAAQWSEWAQTAAHVAENS